MDFKKKIRHQRNENNERKSEWKIKSGRESLNTKSNNWKADVKKEDVEISWNRMKKKKTTQKQIWSYTNRQYEIGCVSQTLSVVLLAWWHNHLYNNDLVLLSYTEIALGTFEGFCIVL